MTEERRPLAPPLPIAEMVVRDLKARIRDLEHLLRQDGVPMTYLSTDAELRAKVERYEAALNAWRKVWGLTPTHQAWHSEFQKQAFTTACEATVAALAADTPEVER